MRLIKLALMLFMILSISGCAWLPFFKGKEHSVKQACRFQPTIPLIKLNLSRSSQITDYQTALIFRKAEVKMCHADIERLADCVDESTRGK